MQLSNQCCTVSQGKRLTELGVNAPSYFIHHVQNVANLIQESWVHIKADAETYPAYTVAELGAMLPAVIPYNKKDCFLSFNRSVSGNIWYCNIEDIRNPKLPLFEISGNTLAECTASALIHLLESKLITPEQCATNLSH